MKKARNNDDEFNESGEDMHQVINTDSEEIKPPPPKEEQDPLAETVKEKSYAKSNVTIDPSLLNTPIPEPVFVAQPPPPPPAPPPTTTTPIPPPPPPPPPVNPDMQHLSDKDKKTAATRGAEMAIQMYVWLNDAANKLITIPERKLDKLHKQALIDLALPINYNGRWMTMKEFIGQFNSQIGDTFIVSEKFKEEVMPLLVEIFEKRGVGMTTEQQLMFIVGKDIAGKLSIAYMMIQQRKSMIDALKDTTEQFKKLDANSQYYYKNAGQPQQPPPPPPQQAPPPPPQPEQPVYTQTSTEVTTYQPETEVSNIPVYEQQRNQTVPGELNAQNFVDQTINPDSVQPGSTIPPDNSEVFNNSTRQSKKSKRNKLR